MTEPKKLSLNEQINELDWEIHERRIRFQRLVAQGKLRQGEADYHTLAMAAVRDTLLWFQANEGTIREAFAAKREAAKRDEAPAPGGDGQPAAAAVEG